MSWLDSLFSWVGGGGGSGLTQSVRDGVSAMGPAEKPQTALSASGQSSAGGPAAGGGLSSAMTEGFAKILAASLLNTPSISYPGAVAPPRGQPFQYVPTKAIPVGPRTPLGR